MAKKKKYEISRFVDREKAIHYISTHLENLKSKIMASYSVSFEYEIELSDMEQKDDFVKITIYNGAYNNVGKIEFVSITEKINNLEKLFEKVDKAILE